MGPSTRLRGALAVVVVTATACSWGMVGHDGGRSSASPLDAKLTPANVNTFAEAWRATPGPIRPSAPVASAGRVFVTTQPSGGTPGALESYDAAGVQGCDSGAPANCTAQWSNGVKLDQSTVLPPVSPPIAAGGRVWAGGSAFDIGLLYDFIYPVFTVAGGYDPATGTKVSSSGISGGYPAEAGGAIYGYEENNFTSTSPGMNRFQEYATIEAVPEDGSPARTVLINPPFGGISVVGDRLYLAHDGVVDAYDSNPAVVPCGPASYEVPDGFYPFYSCTPLWSTALTHGASLDGLPTVANGLLYVSEIDGSVEVFDATGCGAATCGPLWTARAGTTHVGQVAVTDSTLYVPSDDGHLYAFPSTGCGAASCPPTWSVDVGSGVHAPSVAGSIVFAGTQDGHLVAIDARGCGTASCPVLRSVGLGAALRQPIAVSDGRVFAVTDDGVLHGLASP